MSSRINLSPDDNLRAMATEQRREIAAAKDLESDMDLAFRLQLQEAINASISFVPSTSAASPRSPPRDLAKPDGSNDNVPDLQSVELLKFEQEIKDRLLSEAEFKKIRDDLHRRIHDQKLAEEIENMPEDEWEEIGGNFERPFGEGSSKSVGSEIFRVFFKGLVESEVTVKVKDNVGRYKSGVFSGIGVAICDSRDELLFEVRKPLCANGINRRIAEFMALIEGLNAALTLELPRIVFYCDYFPIYQFVTGRWNPKQRKIEALVDQVTQLREKFTYCIPSLVARNDVKFAFKLAREAIVSQVNRSTDTSAEGSLYETCVICFEEMSIDEIFSVDGCMHRFCYSCMKQHVEVKMLHGMVPKCPHEGCDCELKVDSCSKFLTPKLVEIMKQRKKEASIPVTEKLYCPYPKCSALMSKGEVSEYSRSSAIDVGRSGSRKCIKCNGLFCIDCKVPWHNNMTCFAYKKRYPNPPGEDLKLKTLAQRNMWRQCVKCNHMIELAAGCYHMTCRSPLPVSVSSVLEEGINLFKLHTSRHGRLESTKGTYATEWTKWEKELREILSSNSEYLDSVQVPFEFAVKQVLEQLKAVAKGEYSAPVTEKRRLGAIVYAAVSLPVAEIHEFLERIAEKDPNIETFFKEKNLKDSLTKAHVTLAHKRSHGVTAVANYGSFLNQKVPVDITALLFSGKLAALEAHTGSVNGEKITSKNQWPHVTLWTGEGVAAKDANALPQLVTEGKAARVGIDPPITITGVLQFY